MASAHPATLRELVFEQHDVGLFKIPDIKSRTSAVQNYFFPRFEFLLRYTLYWIQEIYGVNPYETMTFVYRPDNRRAAMQNQEFHDAYIGLSGKRTEKPLAVLHEDGTPFYFHPTYLMYRILFNGQILVELMPFRYKVDPQFVDAITQLVQDNLQELLPVLGIAHISPFHSAGDNFAVEQLYETGFGTRLYSPSYYLPISTTRGLKELVLAFTALYPLLDSSVAIAEGNAPQLPEMLDKFKWWMMAGYQDFERDFEDLQSEVLTTNDMPELDSYTFVRPGLWWAVLARDKWTCQSCGRKPEHGITLQVDHIKPRSKGGTDDMSNLQTLCRKCNIGKSNKDQTDLRMAQSDDDSSKNL